jgi:hypothetical protein
MVWTDKDSCGGCNHCGMDMDMEPFCTAPPVAEKHPNGLLIGQAQRLYCRKDGKLTLWVVRT